MQTEYGCMLREFWTAIKGDDEQKCMAVVDDETREVCNEAKYGRGIVEGGHEIIFCRSHVPSDAMVAGGRWDPVTFYISETDTEVTLQ